MVFTLSSPPRKITSEGNGMNDFLRKMEASWWDRGTGAQRLCSPCLLNSQEQCLLVEVLSWVFTEIAFLISLGGKYSHTSLLRIQ
jgi:hypothetical protein